LPMIVEDSLMNWECGLRADIRNALPHLPTIYVELGCGGIKIGRNGEQNKAYRGSDPRPHRTKRKEGYHILLEGSS
jgi:hypothetical protein